MRCGRRSETISSLLRDRSNVDTASNALHLIAHQLAERAVVIDDLSQRQMVIKKQEHETPKERRKRQMRNRMVYNDWGLYGFVQMLARPGPHTSAI